MHQSVKLTNAIWLLQLVISSPRIHALGDPSQAPTGIRTRIPNLTADNLPTDLSLLSITNLLQPLQLPQLGHGQNGLLRLD